MLVLKRYAEPSIHEALQYRRVVLLAGPRQCGKTTLAKQLQIANSHYTTLDDQSTYQSASFDPQGFVQSSYQTMIIDEVQRVPELVIAIKKVVDENTKPGQFLLTGSANISYLPSVKESLAGRITKIKLRTLSQAEILGVEPTFLTKAFNQEFSRPVVFENKSMILEYCFRGGYPEVLKFSQRSRRSWHEDYIAALLERDLKDIAKIERHRAMQELIKILCAWTGKYIDISSIGSHLSLSRNTLNSYINALEALFIVERVEPWTKVDYQRVGRQDKLFICDSGLACSLLRWRIDQVHMDSDRIGKIFENFIFNELMTQINASDGEYYLYHYRDRDHREIDFIVERADGAVLGIEIKAGSSVGKGDFKHLMWLQRKVAERDFMGIVLYTGTEILPFGNKLWAIPISCLWH
jgi:uncharacterized protein